jgi:hypothetical protein
MKYLVYMLFLGFVLLFSCQEKPATGEGPYDSLFLGIHFGMDKKVFYDYCWEMNKQKKFIHGPTNENVEYKLENELDYPVYMRFYPNFFEDRIYQMPVTFTYESWAPWNKNFDSKVLIEKLIPVLERWYNVKFQSKVLPKTGKAYANITGNRRISVFIKDDQYVQVIFTDLPAEKMVLKKIDEMGVPVK